MNIFQKIENVHGEISGWCSQQKAQTLASIVLASRPAISLEIGIWFGKSLLPVALVHQHLGIGKVIAIDPWFAGCSVAGQENPADAEWWRHQDRHELAYNSFLAKVKELGLRETVDVQRMHSDEFDPPDGIGLLSLDGNHGVQAIKDIERYAPKVKLGGFLVADDLKWTGGAVERAISLLPVMGFIELYTVEDKESANHWAVFERVK